jgi:hypothetical protein
VFKCLKPNCDHPPAPHIHCSGLSRPMNCAGSLFFNDLPPEATNEAAEEGTACGELLQFLLTKPNMQSPTHASNGVPFDDDMRFYAVKVRDEIMSQSEYPLTSEKNCPVTVLCETHIDWQTRSGIWIRGRYDAAYVSEGVLCIDDLKYGYGLVEVKENWQLLGYAIGEIIRRGIAFDRIRLRIIQPRAQHEDGTHRSWFLTYSELLAYKEQIEQRMQAIADGLKDLQSGPQCKYCPAAAVCPAFNKAFHRGVDLAHTFLQDNISDDELSYQLKLAYRVNEIFKTRLSSIEALALNRIRAGKIINGFGLDQRLANRTWKPNVTPEVVKMMTGVDLYKKELLSPAQAEKIGLNEEFLKTVTERKFLGAKLKPMDTSKVGDKIFGNPNKET